ncbi:MAG: hypothetical protein ACRDCB_10245 [Clostridium sp.]
MNNKIEKYIYDYYKNKKQVEIYKFKIKKLKENLEKIENDIKSINISIDYYQNGISITDRVQTSLDTTSFAEKEICNEVDKLEREHLITNKKIWTINLKIRSIDQEIIVWDNLIDLLSEEEVKFIYMKYKQRKSMIFIAQEMNIAQATAYRKKDLILKEIYENYMRIS